MNHYFLVTIGGWYENMLENYFDFGYRRLKPIIDILIERGKLKGVTDTNELYNILVEENLPAGWKRK